MRKLISVIAAIDKNRAIGKNNQLLFHLKKDLKYFANITKRQVVIMGRKTFESLPNGALPDRECIVLSSDTEYNAKGCTVTDSLEKAITIANNSKKAINIFIIGGSSVYEKVLKSDIVDLLYLTQIDESVDDADTFFPKINFMEWNLISKEDLTENNINYSISKYASNKMIQELMS